MLADDDLQKIDHLVAKRLRPTETKLNGVETKVGKFEKRFDEMEQKIDDTEKRLIIQLKKELAQTEERIISQVGDFITESLLPRIGEKADKTTVDAFAKRISIVEARTTSEV